MDFTRLGNGAEAQALTYAALGLAFSSGEHPVAKIVVGFPVEVMRDESKVKNVFKGVESLDGRVLIVSCMINDKEYCITIDKVSVIAQPLGGFYSWAINKEGKFKVPSTKRG